MSITSVSANQVSPSAAGAVSTAASAASGFGGSLQSALAGQTTGAGDAAQTAYKTEPGRGVPSGGHRHHHHGRGSMDTSGTQTAGAQGGAGITTNQATTKTSGGLLLSDMRRGLQAYGATVKVG